MKKKEAGVATLSFILIAGVLAAAAVYGFASFFLTKYMVNNDPKYQAEAVLNLTPSPYPSVSPAPSRKPKPSPPVRISLEDLPNLNTPNVNQFNHLPKDPQFAAAHDTLEKVVAEIGNFLVRDKGHYQFKKSDAVYVSFRKGAFEPFYAAKAVGWRTELIPIVDGQYHIDSVMLGGTDELMAKLGFELDPFNSSPDVNRTFYLDFEKFYTRGNIVCVMGFPTENSGSNQGYAYMRCTNQLEQAKKDEAKYVSLKESPINVIRLSRQVGQFAIVQVDDVRGFGHPTLVRDLGSSVEALAILLEYPSCEVIDKWKVPSELVKKCVDNIGTKSEKLRDNTN